MQHDPSSRTIGSAVAAGRAWWRPAAIILLLATSWLTLSPAAFGQDNDVVPTLSPTPIDSNIAVSVVGWIRQRHYNCPNIDDTVSAAIFDEYFDRLDPEHHYFLDSDLKEFAPYRLILDDKLITGDLTFAFKVYNRFLERVHDRVVYLQERSHQPFDFTVDEDMLIDRREAPWPKSVDELNEIWRKNLKNYVLSTQLGEEKVAKADDAAEKKPEAAPAEKTAPADNAAPAKADAPEAKPPADEAAPESKPPAEPPLTPAEKFVKRYVEYYNVLKKSDNPDVLESFLTTFTATFDPHSTYFNSRSSEDFDIAMKLSLEGIGATLTAEDGYTKVVNLVVGGPAALDGRLKPGDYILSVAEKGKDSEDVVNMPLDRVVRLIRGEKGTVVVLGVAHNPHETPHYIDIERDKVKLTEQEAKGRTEVYKAPDGHSYTMGIVYLPSFYADFDGQRMGVPGAKSTTTDVKKIIDGMIADDHIDALVMDLRWNGGGALSEAIRLAGLFIPSGPIVQVRSRRAVEENRDNDGGFGYDMPLAVLVNHTSASASEIFSAAIQDYGRGVIVGDERTHGKGTVQTVQPLDRLRALRDANPGALKYTMAKFYRVNGGSTQQRGVTPDFILPSFLDYIVKGEADLKHVMPWDEIPALSYVRSKPDMRPLLPELTKLEQARLQDDPEYKQLLTDVREFGKRRDVKTISLNREKRLELKKEDLYWAERSEKVLSKTKVGKLQYSHELGVPTDDWYTKETFNILSDVIRLTGGDRSAVAKGGDATAAKTDDAARTAAPEKAE